MFLYLQVVFKLPEKHPLLNFVFKTYLKVLDGQLIIGTEDV